MDTRGEQIVEAYKNSEHYDEFVEQMHEIGIEDDDEIDNFYFELEAKFSDHDGDMEELAKDNYLKR